jgi:hypothetical protein
MTPRRSLVPSLLACLALATQGGCAVSAGSVNVGQWRAKRQVDTSVCFEAPSGGCAQTLEVGRESKARSFGGGIVAWFNPGYLRASRGGDVTQAAAFNSSFEYLRGRGGLAWGGRLGANLGSNLKSQGGKTFFSMPLSGLVYWGYPLWNIYVGGGYTAYASAKTTVGDSSSTETLRGFHLLGGARLVLKSARNYRISISSELEQQYLGDTLMTTITGNVGIHL